jgi:DNA adenine methylase
MTALSRPLLRWHGGKWRLGPWIIAHLPPHRIYVEPFGGAASVLLRKPRSYAEIYNDLDGDVVNLFRVLRSERAGELIQAVELTPFARAEFEASYQLSEEPVERARRLIVRSFMGFGSDGSNRVAVRTGFRANSNRSGTTPARDWAGYPVALRAIVGRLSGVIIERRPALEVMRQHDQPDALHYLDPPYMPSTRSGKRKDGQRYHGYVHEMTSEDHWALLSSLREIHGAVVISCYATRLYDETLGAAGWRRVTTAALADGAVKRTEVLWLNSRAAEQIDGELAFEEPPHGIRIDAIAGSALSPHLRENGR